MTHLLRTIYALGILSCCIIAIALTDIHGHTKLGPLIISYNERPAEYLEASMPARVIMEGMK